MKDDKPSEIDPIQQKRDILIKYHKQGGSLLITTPDKPEKRIMVDNINKGEFVYYVLDSDPYMIPVPSITRIRDNKTGEILYPLPKKKKKIK